MEIVQVIVMSAQLIVMFSIFRRGNKNYAELAERVDRLENPLKWEAKDKAAAYARAHAEAHKPFVADPKGQVE